MFLAEKLKECRKERRLSQTKCIAHLSVDGLKVSRSTWDNWEKGRFAPRADELATMCIFFDKPVGYFFDLKRNQTSNDTE